MSCVSVTIWFLITCILPIIYHHGHPPWWTTDYISSTHVHFGNLDFIISMEGELAQVPTTVQTLHFVGFNAITEALEELQLHAPEAHAPGTNQLLGFDYGRLECHLSAFLGPRPS